MLGVLIWWFVDAHKWFKGPKVNIERQILVREGNIVRGIEASSGSSATPSLEEKASRG